MAVSPDGANSCGCLRIPRPGRRLPTGARGLPVPKTERQRNHPPRAAARLRNLQPPPAPPRCWTVRCQPWCLCDLRPLVELRLHGPEPTCLADLPRVPLFLQLADSVPTFVRGANGDHRRLSSQAALRFQIPTPPPCGRAFFVGDRNATCEGGLDRCRSHCCTVMPWGEYLQHPRSGWLPDAFGCPTVQMWVWVLGPKYS